MNINRNHNSDYIFGLDILRAIAILFVLFGHSFQHSVLPLWIKHFGAFGSIGVEIFFILSGFLIGGIILKLLDKDKFHSYFDITDFWKRRWMRTLPMYIITLLAFLRFDYHGSHSLTYHPEYWLFLQNFAWPIPDDFFTLSWSLTIEEHFYLWFPIVFFIMIKFFSKRLAFGITAVFFLVFSILYRLSLPEMNFDDWNLNSRMVVLSRLDAIMFGVLMAYIRFYHIIIWEKIYKLSSIFGIFTLLIFTWYYFGAKGINIHFIQVFGVTIQGALFSMLLPFFYNIKLEPKTFFQKTILLTSRLSYSLYLVHILVITFVNQLLSKYELYEYIYPKAYYIYPIYFFFYYLLSFITYSVIEKPFLELRDEKITKNNFSKIIPFVLSVLILVFFIN